MELTVYVMHILAAIFLIRFNFFSAQRAGRHGLILFLDSCIRFRFLAVVYFNIYCGFYPFYVE